MKTTAERMAELRERRKVKGLQELRIWTHPENIPSIKEHARKLERKRAKELK